MLSQCLAVSAIFLIAIGPTRPDAAANWGYELDGRDAQQPAGDDFYRYTNGKWLGRVVIRAGSFKAGPGDDADEAAQTATRTLIESSANDPRNRSRIALVYRSYMDRPTVERIGVGPLRPILNQILVTPSKAQLAWQMGRSLGGFQASPVHLTIDADQRDSQRYSASISLSALGLPGTAYYRDASLRQTRDAYRRYVEKMLTWGGLPRATQSAAEIVALETAIASASAATAATRDDGYNALSADSLGRLAPGFPWAAFFRGAGLEPSPRVTVSEPATLAAMSAVYARAPLATLKAWAVFKTIDRTAQYLPQRFVAAYDHFHLAVLRGQSKPREQWLAGSDAVNEILTGDVSQLFVSSQLSTAMSSATAAMAVNIRAAFAARIAALDWMSPVTKAEALKKLAAMSIEIGAPIAYEDYSTLDIRPGDLFGNITRGKAFSWQQQLRRLGQPVDRHRWQIPPQFVGASNEGQLNLVAVSAALLRPPFFDPRADPAVNYGALGATIGHEMTHGFDDQGRKIDANGNLRNWWTTADAAHFEREVKRLAAQYSTHEPLPGLHVDGAASVGEALADLGGLLIAIDAYHLSLNGRPSPVLDGYTGDQRVFLGFAQQWRAKESAAFLRSTLLTNPHSPPDVRVNETVRNIDSWYVAFGVTPSARLYRKPEDRVRIW